MRAWIIDAFADGRFQGNPAGVVTVHGPFPPVDHLQRVAAQLDVPTTAFLKQAGERRWEIRWFTPCAELDLCGHATLASAFYLHDVLGVPTGGALCFHTRVSGDLLAHWSDRFVALDLPRMELQPCSLPEGLAAALGATPVRCARASDDIVVELSSAEAVRALRPRFDALARFECRGHVVTAIADDGAADFVSRAFFPALGVDEDQVCVSAHCKLGPYWADRLQSRHLSAVQLSGRGGRLVLTVGDRRVRVSGTAVVRGPVALVWPGPMPTPA